MKRKTSLVAICVVALGFIGCHHFSPDEHDIVLAGFEQSNYLVLNEHVGERVCVVGRLSIDTEGVYFALQPLERGELVDFGFSRIKVDLSGEHLERHNLESDRTRRICGDLRDVTPFRQCRDNFCKWYELANAKLG